MKAWTLLVCLLEYALVNEDLILSQALKTRRVHTNRVTSTRWEYSKQKPPKRQQRLIS